MVIDILTVIFIIGIFVNFGYGRYKKKKNGVVGCTQCNNCTQAKGCDSK